MHAGWHTLSKALKSPAEVSRVCQRKGVGTGACVVLVCSWALTVRMKAHHCECTLHTRAVPAICYAGQMSTDMTDPNNFLAANLDKWVWAAHGIFVMCVREAAASPCPIQFGIHASMILHASFYFVCVDKMDSFHFVQCEGS